MSFKIRSVYREQANVNRFVEEDIAEENDVKTDELSLSSQDSDKLQQLLNARQMGQTLTTAQQMQIMSLQEMASNNTMTLEQKKQAIMNSRTAVKPGAKNSIRQTTFEKGYESDMY